MKQIYTNSVLNLGEDDVFKNHRENVESLIFGLKGGDSNF